MFSLLVCLSVLWYGVMSQYDNASDAFCTLYESTCGYNNTNVTQTYVNATYCRAATVNATIDTLTCYFYHLGVAYNNTIAPGLLGNSEAGKELHCGHASGVAPCDPSSPGAQTGAQFCGAVGLWGMSCAGQTGINLNEAQCTGNYTAAYQAEKLCYSWNAAARISAGSPYTADVNNYCAAASGDATGVCNLHGHATPAPSFVDKYIEASGITGNYALKNFIALNVPVALGVCYTAPAGADPTLSLGNIINCNATGTGATSLNLQHMRYSSSVTPTPAGDQTEYLACDGTSNSTGNIRVEQIDVPHGNCAADSSANSYALVSICVIADALNPTNATACTDAVCDSAASSIRKITVPVITGGCVNNGVYSPLVGDIYATVTCTDSSLTYWVWTDNQCTSPAGASTTASSGSDCAYLQTASVPVGGVDIDFQVYLKYETGACVVDGVALTPSDAGSMFSTSTTAIVVLAVFASIVQALFAY